MPKCIKIFFEKMVTKMVWVSNDQHINRFFIVMVLRHLLPHGDPFPL